MSKPASPGRVLATIMFTDAVGFSARMAEHESRTIALIRRDIKYITATCAAHHGRVLKNTGDGLLMYFGSAGDAVATALKIQEAFARAMECDGPEKTLQHRVGIHLGDVLLDEGDVMGDGVNIAARLLGEAAPGGICFSQTVYDVVKHRLALEATYLGPRELKNIREAVPVYQIITGEAVRRRLAPDDSAGAAQSMRVALLRIAMGRARPARPCGAPWQSARWCCLRCSCANQTAPPCGRLAGGATEAGGDAGEVRALADGVNQDHNTTGAGGRTRHRRQHGTGADRARGIRDGQPR